MSMEAKILLKSNTIESLVEITSSIILDVERGHLDQVDNGLKERSRLFSKLQDLDQEFLGKPTAKDQEWLNQLRHLSKLDAELRLKLEEQASMTSKDLKVQEKIRKDLIQTELLTGKGQGFEARG